MLTIGLYGVDDPADSGASHDHGVAVLRNGRVLFCRELERHTRRKHDGRLGAHVGELLAPFMETGEPVRFVLANTFIGRDFVSARGEIEIRAADLEVPDILATCGGVLQVRGRDATAPVSFHTICHEMAHLGTCLPFFGAFRPGSLLVHIDGGASRSCASAWFFDGDRITCLEHGWHPGLKGAVNNFNASALSRWILGLRESDHLSMPGKLMGLASLGHSDPAAMRWLGERGWLRDTLDTPTEVLRAIQAALPHLSLLEFSPCDASCQILAATMQCHLEEEVLRYIDMFREVTGAQHLCYSGGAALNIHANTRIEQKLGFASVSIPPAPSDAGLALGAAAFVEWHSGNPMHRHSPFLNHLRPGQEALPLRPGLPIMRSPEQVARAIATGGIIGVWCGAGELGPRALGHRSILCRPDSIPLRVRLSEGMKQREWYRPVAPMLLPEVACQALQGHRPSSSLGAMMLGAWKVAPAWRQPLQGCVHADGTVRAQVVNEGHGPVAHIHRLLVELRDRHGIQGVINTSFNTRGEPIVQSLEEALLAADAMNLDGLWLGGR